MNQKWQKISIHLPKLYDHAIGRYFHSFYLLLYRTTQKFVADACTIRGNAIAYAVIISIIPLTTIFVQAAKVNRGVIKTHIAAFLAAYGLADTNELMGILDEIMARAETIAGIGFIFVLYSASNFFRHLETAFCHIYRAPRERPLFYRFALYISALVVLPIIIIFTNQIIQKIRYSFERPNLQSIMLRNSSTTQRDTPTQSKWISTSDGILQVYSSENKKKQQIDLSQKITESAPYREYLIDLKNNRQGQTWEVLETPTYNYQLDKHERFNIIACLQTATTVYAISRAGTIYYTKDEGQSWSYQQLLFNSNNNVYAPQIQDIHMNKLGHILLLINEISHSTLVVRRNENSWQHTKLNSNYKHIFSIDNIRSATQQTQAIDEKAPTASSNFSFKNGLYLGGKAKLLYSNDEGRNWQGPYEQIFGERKVSINAMQADREGNIYLGGSNGAFWIHTKDNKKLYPDIQNKFNQHIHGLAMQDNGNGILYGNQGLLRYTSDRGRTWHLPDSNFRHKDINLLSCTQSKDGSIYLGGNDNTFLHIPSIKLSTQAKGNSKKNANAKNTPPYQKKYDTSGLLLATLSVNTLSETPYWQSLLLNILIEPLLIVVIFIVLTLLYILVPNTRVSWQAATSGAAFTSISIMIFLSFFRIWLSASSTTAYIYGAWAAIPLGMLIVLVSTYIVLFGLELAYVLQNSFLYEGGKMDPKKKDCTLWNCLLLLCLCYHSIQKRKRPLTHQSAQQNFGGNNSNLEITRRLLIDSNLLYHDPIRNEYLPLEAASAVSLNDLREQLAKRILRIPSRLLKPELQETLSEFMKTPQLQSIDKDSNLTIAEILPTFFSK